jgi:hypothetical protein
MRAAGSRPSAATRSTCAPAIRTCA